MAEAILALARAPPKDLLQRKQLYEAARELMFRTEDRHDTTHRIYFSGIQLTLADIATDLGVFATLVKTPERTWAPEQLAQQLQCDPLLLSRILRGLAAYGMIAVNAEGQYEASQAVHTLADQGVAACIRHNVLTVSPCMNALPEFLRKNGHKNPTDARNGAGQLAFNTDQDMFTWLGTQPEKLKWTMLNMAASRVGQESWIDNSKLFPTEIFQDPPDGALFVDVGAGVGHQSVALRQAHANLQGKVYLQDLPFTIERLDTERLSMLNIEPMAHDFQTEQPIKNARVYYLRNILHDWPDRVCLNILGKLRAAMAPESSLVIDEIVVKEVEAQWQQVNYDMIMMGTLSAMERTARQWSELFKASGFAIKEIREYDSDNGESLIIGTPI